MDTLDRLIVSLSVFGASLCTTTALAIVASLLP